MLKKYLKDNSGMALSTVMAIIMIISILATGMYVFSSNELNFSTIDYNQEKAQYLARSGVEIVSKAAPEALKTIENLDVEPVTTKLYLHKDTSPTASEKDVIINSIESNNIGVVEVSVSQKTKTVNGNDIPVFSYQAKASVNGAKAKAKGFSLPPASAVQGDGTNKAYLGWVSKNGVICYDKSKYSPAQSINIEGTWLEHFIKWLFGKTMKVTLYSADYSGVITVQTSDMIGPKLVLPEHNDPGAYAWAADAMFFELPIDLTGSACAQGFALAANTFVFNREIKTYRSTFGTNAGNVVLVPRGDNSTVYFKDNVYYYYGIRNRATVIEKGSYYLKNNLDIMEYKDMSSAQKANVLVKIPSDKPEAKIPDVSSLTKVIWE